MTHKCKRCSAAFLSKNRLYSYIRECYIKTTTLFNNDIAVSYICSVTLISTSEKLFNQVVALYISTTTATVIATTTATTINKISTSSHAIKITTFASKSQIASNIIANPLVPTEISLSESLSASPLLAYRAILSISPEYKSIKSQNHLTMNDLYTRYAPLKHAKSSYLTMQDLYMKYASLKSLSFTRLTSLISTRFTSSSSTRLTSRTLFIITIKNLYKRFKKFVEKIVSNTLKCTQHSLNA